VIEVSLSKQKHNHITSVIFYHFSSLSRMLGRISNTAGVKRLAGRGAAVRFFGDRGEGDSVSSWIGKIHKYIHSHPPPLTRLALALQMWKKPSNKNTAAAVGAVALGGVLFYFYQKRMKDGETK
jgi:hypothetical protein